MSKLKFSLDHVVFFVNDLAEATRLFKRAHFNVKEGGKHPFGTYNNLIYFADGSYLELVSYEKGMKGLRERAFDEIKIIENKENYKNKLNINDLEKLETRWVRDVNYQGIVDYAIRTNSKDLSINQLNLIKKEQYNDLSPIFINGSRINSNGLQMQWELTFFKEQNIHLPFVISDKTDMKYRIISVDKSEHENTCIGIHKIFLPVENLSISIEKYKTCYQLKPFYQDDQRANYQLGNSIIELVQYNEEISSPRIIFLMNDLKNSKVNFQLSQKRGNYYQLSGDNFNEMSMPSFIEQIYFVNKSDIL